MDGREAWYAVRVCVAVGFESVELGLSWPVEFVCRRKKGGGSEKNVQ